MIQYYHIDTKISMKYDFNLITFIFYKDSNNLYLFQDTTPKLIPKIIVKQKQIQIICQFFHFCLLLLQKKKEQLSILNLVYKRNGYALISFSCNQVPTMLFYLIKYVTQTEHKINNNLSNFIRLISKLFHTKPYKDIQQLSVCNVILCHLSHSICIKTIFIEKISKMIIKIKQFTIFCHFMEYFKIFHDDLEKYTGKLSSKFIFMGDLEHICAIYIFQCCINNSHPLMKQVQAQKIKNCQKHCLILTPKNSQCFYSRKIAVSFCDQPIHIPRQKKGKTIKTEIIGKHYDGPIFNTDKNYASLGFILQSEKNYYESNAYRIINEYQRNMQDYTNEKSELLHPKPRSKNNYCNVCKCNYQDYIYHIQSDPHKYKIKSSKFNKYILELQNEFAQKNINNKYEQPKQIEKISCDKSTAAKNNQNQNDDDNIQLLYIRKPRKIVKTDPVINQIQNVPKNDNMNFSQFWNMPYMMPGMMDYPYMPPYCPPEVNWMFLANMLNYNRMNMYYYGQNPINQINRQAPEIKKNNQIIVLDSQE